MQELCVAIYQQNTFQTISGRNKQKLNAKQKERGEKSLTTSQTDSSLTSQRINIMYSLHFKIFCQGHKRHDVFLCIIRRDDAWYINPLCSNFAIISKWERNYAH